MILVFLPRANLTKKSLEKSNKDRKRYILCLILEKYLEKEKKLWKITFLNLNNVEEKI